MRAGRKFPGGFRELRGVCKSSGGFLDVFGKCAGGARGVCEKRSDGVRSLRAGQKSSERARGLFEVRGWVGNLRKFGGKLEGSAREVC